MNKLIKILCFISGDIKMLVLALVYMFILFPNTTLQMLLSRSLKNKTDLIEKYKISLPSDYPVWSTEYDNDRLTRLDLHRLHLDLLKLLQSSFLGFFLFDQFDTENSSLFFFVTRRHAFKLYERRCESIIWRKICKCLFVLIQI